MVEREDIFHLQGIYGLQPVLILYVVQREVTGVYFLYKVLLVFIFWTKGMLSSLSHVTDIKERIGGSFRNIDRTFSEFHGTSFSELSSCKLLMVRI